MLASSAPRVVVRRRRIAHGVGVVVVIAAAGACRAGRDTAREARDPERQEVRRAAAEAAWLATSGDTGARHGTRGRTRHETGSGTAGDTGSHVNLDIRNAGGLTRASDPPLGPGDVRIASTDGALVLALVGDTVRMRLGDRATARIRRAVDTSRAPTSGFGGFVASTVRAAVGGAMSEVARFAVLLPVRDIQELRYENGTLHVGTANSRLGRKGVSGDARFAPGDAERFIAAVRARQRALGGGG